MFHITTSPQIVLAEVHHLLAKGRLFQALKLIQYWSKTHQNTWLLDVSTNLLIALTAASKKGRLVIQQQTYDIAECIVTGGFATASAENPDSKQTWDISTDIRTEPQATMPPEVTGSEAPQPSSSIAVLPPPSPPPPPPPPPQLVELETKPTKVGAKPPKGGSKPPSQAKNTAKPTPSKENSGELMGGLFYNIPKTMKQNEDAKCVVRIAFDAKHLTKTDDVNENFDNKVTKTVRIAEIMEVELLEGGLDEAFKIQSISQKQQFLDRSDATEWQFFVRPLKSGTFKLVLKISIIERINDIDRRKEAVMIQNISIITTGVVPPQAFLPAQMPMQPLKTLLFMGANPPGTRLLQLDVEHSHISESIHNKYNIEVERFLSIDEISNLIVSKTPSIVHFSGHGQDPLSKNTPNEALDTRGIGLPKDYDKTGGIVVFDAEKRGMAIIETAQLDFIFETIVKNMGILIDVVVFNSCYSESQAKVVGKYVPYVIGTSRAIGDDIAIAFAAGFYTGISNALPVEKAFLSGRMTAVLKDIKAKDLIVLYKNGVKFM